MTYSIMAGLFKRSTRFLTMKVAFLGEGIEKNVKMLFGKYACELKSPEAEAK